MPERRWDMDEEEEKEEGEGGWRGEQLAGGWQKLAARGEYRERATERADEAKDTAGVAAMQGLDEGDGVGGNGVGGHRLVVVGGRGGGAPAGCDHENEEEILKLDHGRRGRRGWWWGPLEYGECAAEGADEAEDTARAVAIQMLDEGDGDGGEGVGGHGLAIVGGRGGGALAGRGHEDGEGILRPGPGRSGRRGWWWGPIE